MVFLHIEAMKKTFKSIFLFIILLLFWRGTIVCNQDGEKTANPFFGEFKTPFGVPPFDLIKIDHYIPAFEKGMAEEQVEIDTIVNNPESPAFENTVLAFNNTGKLLTKVRRVFFTIDAADTNPQLQEISRKISPLLTLHRDNISLNDKLFQRIKTVYQNRHKQKYDPLQIRVIEKNYHDFIRNGADLNPEDKKVLREINQEIAKLQLQFGENMLQETNINFKLVIENRDDLAGLPQGAIDAAAQTAKEAGIAGKWVFTLQKPSWIPFLQYAQKRELREQLYRGYFRRGDNNNEFDNKKIMLAILKLRARRARLLGYKTFAEYAVADNMAKTPENVLNFMRELMIPAQNVAIRDRDEMQKIIDREGGNFKLDLWDWWYYAEKLKKEKFDLDEAEITPYFVLANVRDGMFYLANKLYGITFSPLKNMPVYNPELEVFEAKEADGSHLGVLYLDYYPRPGKGVGAWCGEFRSQGYDDQGKKIRPVITITTNFTRPNGAIPALLTYSEATTLFHEFGHALHGLFTDGKYRRIAGDVPNDMGELPASIMENWLGETRVLKVIARHYKTGQMIPQELLEKLRKSITFNQAFTTVEYIGASVLDMDWHGIAADKEYDVIAFENESMKRLGLIKEILPRYRTSYFSHICGGYAAGYYVYLWAAELDADAFAAFEASGNIFNKEIAARFRKYILQDGGNDEGMVQYRKFRGKNPSIKALLKKRGLL